VEEINGDLLEVDFPFPIRLSFGIADANSRGKQDPATIHPHSPHSAEGSH
jgi:hypothetical protein